MVLTSCARRRRASPSTRDDVTYFVLIMCYYPIKPRILSVLVILRTGLARGPELAEDRVSCRPAIVSQQKRPRRVETREEQDDVLVAFDLVDAHDLLRSFHGQKRARPGVPQVERLREYLSLGQRGRLDHELLSPKLGLYENQRSHRVWVQLGGARVKRRC